MRRVIRLGAVVTGAAATVLAFAAGPAEAAPAGFLGNCDKPVLHDSSVTGWCDGNGPDWTYQAFANCKTAVTGKFPQLPSLGEERWAGDRRGSTAWCPVGYWATDGSLSVRHNGKVVKTIYT